MSGNDEFQVRNVGRICVSEGVRVWVDHLWQTQPAGDGDADEGEIGPMIEAAGANAEAFLSPEDALLLADRLHRAADLVLEAREDAPDADREYQRLIRHP